MTTLALEFSSAERSVALVSEGRVLAQASQSAGRSTHTLRLITEVLERAGVAKESVQRIAVGIGPGSYTGIRIAISAAQGWHLATGCRVAAIGSFAALARALGEEAPGRWILAADAQRQEFAVATALDGELVESPGLVSREGLALRIAAGERAAGVDAVAVGVGALARHPEARWVALLAEDGRHDLTPEELAPIYLREVSFVKAPPQRAIPGITD
jgi:tRNA threonylcarbamoyladenosine biosynthesis protein TsaB